MGLTGALDWLRRSTAEPSGKLPEDASSAATVVQFLGALFGRELSQADRSELTDRLGFALAASSGLALDYRVLVRRLDRWARETGAAGFLAADTARQAIVVDRIMRIQAPTLLERLGIHLLRGHRDLFHMRFETVPQLAWLYRHSGVPWRVRGYARWPGIPGDWSEVTRPGPPYA